MSQLNVNQITRKDARNRFVESLNDAFDIGKIHFVFATYDVNKPSGQRQTNNVHIYINVDEYLELCRKLECGEFKHMMQTKKKNKDDSPLFEHLGGTSAKILGERGRARKDGKSLSRTAKLTVGDSTDLVFWVNSGPGEVDAKGLIVPKFGSKPENSVVLGMSFESFSELLLSTKMHYFAWLAAKYAKEITGTALFGGNVG